jgi:hypothetical protein
VPVSILLLFGLVVMVILMLAFLGFERWRFGTTGMTADQGRTADA